MAVVGAAAAAAGGSQTGRRLAAEVPQDLREDRAARRGILLLHLFLWTPALSLPPGLLSEGIGASKVVVFTALKTLIAVLQLVHSHPRLRAVRVRYWRWTFAGQAVLSFAPHFAFGARWASGGNLAGSALLLFRGPLSWLLFGLILSIESAVQLGYGAGPGQAVSVTLDGSLVIALATFGLSRLVEVVFTLHATRVAAMGAAVGQERLRAAREAFGFLDARLSAVVRSANSARQRAAADPATAGAAVAELGDAARDAVTDARAAALAFRKADLNATGRAGAARAADRGVSVTPQLAFLIVVVMSVTGATANTVGILEHQRSVTRIVAGVAGLAVLVTLQIYHAVPRASRRAPFAGWALLVQAALAYAPVVVFGSDWIGMTVYLAACVPIVVRAPVSWIVAAAIVASEPAMLAGLPHAPSFWYLASYVLTSLWDVLVFYAPIRLAALAVELDSTRAALTRSLRAQERLRIARDVHDLLASSMWAVALKADLAERLLLRDPRRARSELAGAARLAQRTAAEARSLRAERPETTLAEEIAAARSVLVAAGVRSDLRQHLPDLPLDVDLVLAVTVREAVTNVLRHSTARYCRITVWRDADTAGLRVRNDGVAASTTGTTGTGIGNLRARVEALGGVLTAGLDGAGRFVLTVELPVGSAAAMPGVSRSLAPMHHGSGDPPP
jgi:two-component system, NarL family, sensor histidine kinase DesK